MPRNESRIWTKKYELDPARKLSITVVEDPTLDFGGDDAWCSWCLWPAAKVLVRYLATLDDAELAGRSVLELGAGCGAVGMYMARRGCSPVVLTDTYRALPLLKRNVRANALPCEISNLSWGMPVNRLPWMIRSRVPFDLVVASDCSYDFVKPEIPSPSIDGLLFSARSCGAKALICVSRRPNEVEAFDAAVARAGLSPEVVFSGELEAAKVEGVGECIVYAFDFRPPSPAAPPSADDEEADGEADGAPDAVEPA